MNDIYVLAKPILKFGTNGKKEYFAIRRSNLIIGNFVNVFFRDVGDTNLNINNKIIFFERVPYDTWLIADCPDNIKKAKGLKYIEVSK